MEKKIKRIPKYFCIKCEKKFYDHESANRAISFGCSKCGNKFIDLFINIKKM